MVKVTGDNEVYHCQFDLTLWKPKQLTLRIVDFNLLCGRSNDDLNSECIWFAWPRSWNLKMMNIWWESDDTILNIFFDIPMMYLGIPNRYMTCGDSARCKSCSYEKAYAYFVLALVKFQMCNWTDSKIKLSKFITSWCIWYCLLSSWISEYWGYVGCFFHQSQAACFSLPIFGSLG